MNRQTKNTEGERSPGEVYERFRGLVEGWMAEDLSYDREAWPELREGLDRNRSEYRKHFPQDEPKAERRPTCLRRQTRDQ